MRLFFIAVVVVPTLAVAVVIFALIASSERGQGDARLAARQGAAINLADEDQLRARRAANVIAEDPLVAAAIRARDFSRLETIVRRDAKRVDASRVRFEVDNGPTISFGSPDAMLPAVVTIKDAGTPVATLRIAVTTADDYAARVRKITEEEILIRRGARTLAVTADPFATVANIPDSDSGTVTVAGERYRTASFTLPAFDPGRFRVTAFETADRTEGAIERGRWLAVLFLSGFVLLALIAGAAITRSLQLEIDTFLRAARRLGSGDFGAKIPTRGRDEFAQLGQEFNAMSAQLEARLGDLRRERVRFARSLRRLGEAFASNLDREALLEIVVETAVDTLSADGGQASVRERPDVSPTVVASKGSPNECAEAVQQAQEAVLARNEMIAVETEHGHAMGYPLEENVAGEEGHGTNIGLVLVWRAGSPFTLNERELFEYLAAQAAVSVENVGRHEVVVKEAMTDALTGLPNRRRFDQRLAHEVERARSLGSSIALVTLDIDDFKAVNDTYGHPTGDVVLQAVAEVLLSASRDPDTPARIGGEEMAVVLPGASESGAQELAERVRARIAELTFRPVDDPGAPEFSVTASLGISASVGSDADEEVLLSEADAALYEAKRTGKNRAVTASR
jgi:diguanylate cyclase (GGDEF)-like protein